MSIKLMTKVWENGPEDRTEAMVLLALADRANDDGSSCFPSIAEVSQRSRLSRRGTQKAIRRLDEKGYLTVHENAGPGGTNNYQLHPARLKGRTEFAGEGEPSSPGGEHHSPGGEPDDEKGRSTFARNRQEPSDNRQKNREGDAPAHEDSSEESPDQLFSALVDVWRSVGTAPPLNRNTEDVLWEWAQDGTVQDIGLFREVLQEQSADTTAKGCGLSTGILLKEYRKQRDAGKLEPWQKEDGRYSVDEEGRVCFKGVPLSETGPQNVYDDYEGDTRKDGSMRREPEVSPS